jgi:hypothetical protein
MMRNSDRDPRRLGDRAGIRRPPRSAEIAVGIG